MIIWLEKDSGTTLSVITYLPRDQSLDGSCETKMLMPLSCQCFGNIGNIYFASGNNKICGKVISAAKNLTLPHLVAHNKLEK